MYKVANTAGLLFPVLLSYISEKPVCPAQPGLRCRLVFIYYVTMVHAL